MTNIAVPVPPSLASYKGYLREFISGMIRKLDINSHKSTPNRQHIEDIINMLRVELDEFEEQLNSDKFDQNSLVELMDAANFAFLAFVALRMDGVKTEKEKLILKFLDIDTDTGKVYCKATRPGSQYKVGEEIKGTLRAGYIDIKLQSARDRHCSSTIPRSHLIWWRATGTWPTGIIDHINRVRDDDRITNLRDISFSENSQNHGRERLYPPFVTPYLPTGRQHLIHYGKFVYQRHHNGINIRCAYYDTPEEAASQGEQDWLKKISEIMQGRQK